MEILLIMLAGVGAGRFFPEKYKEKNEKVQLFCTLLLIFSMGVSLGRREGFFAELGTLGVQSFLFFLIPASRASFFSSFLPFFPWLPSIF